MLLLPLISLLLFGITIALPNSEGPRQNEERHDTPSEKNMLTMMQKGEPSHDSDPYRDSNGFMSRSDDEEDFYNSQSHFLPTFILYPLQMLDFSRNMLNIISGFENEDENHVERGLPRFLDRILTFGNTLNNRFRDSFEPHERYRRRARGRSSSSTYYGCYRDDCSVKETYCTRRAFLCEHRYSDRHRSSRRGRRSRRRNDDEHNGDEDCRAVVLLDSSCNLTPRKQDSDEPETIVENTKVAVIEDYSNDGGNAPYYGPMPTMDGEEGEIIMAKRD